jgi:hypothetical protein
MCSVDIDRGEVLVKTGQELEMLYIYPSWLFFFGLMIRSLVVG